MNQGELLRYVLTVLEDLSIPHMVVGSFASSAYGEPRLTRDIDIVIDPGPSQIASLCGRFPPDEYYVSLEAAETAVRQRGQFNIIHPESGNKIDLMIAKDDAWGREQLSRRHRVRLLADQEGFAARPEDVIVAKMLYYAEGGSEKHLRDIAGILKVSGDEVDRAYVAKWAEELGVMEVWQAVLRRVG